jgi:LacI family xylobiose transport system transcriptional regulator
MRVEPEAESAPIPSRATLSQVAAAASVSISTVSKVLNGRSGVASATRQRVEELLHERGYSRRNSSQSAQLIELVFAEIESAWAIEIITGVERIARENDLTVALTESGDRHAPSPEWIQGALRRQPAGVILIFSDLSADHKQQLRSRDIPFVIIDPSGDPAPDVPSIGSANWSGGFQATRHLIDQGHREIGIITGPEDMMCSTARLSGYRAALDAARIPFRQEYVAIGEFHHSDGVNRGEQLLALPHPPTAIFAGSDLQALGVYEAARARGLSVPGDLSVVGYDDLKIAQWAGPPLTTVRQPLAEMAEEATKLVLRLRDNPQTENLRIDLATRLVVRGSTRSI